MRYRILGPVFLLVLGACSSGGYAPHDGAPVPVDLATDLRAAADLPTTDDASSGACITSFSCEAVTAEHGCGVTTATGQRHPDQGAPYCSDKSTRQGCSCDLVRCVSPAPLCPGTYQAVFKERLLFGCDGTVSMPVGGCSALWNTVQSASDGSVLSDRALTASTLDWAFVPYQQAFKVMSPAVVKLTVQQSCWFSDVSGKGNSGRSEVSQITVAAQ